MKNRPKKVKKKYKVGSLILAAALFIGSIYGLLINSTLVNPFVEITGQVEFAEASTRTEMRGSRGGSYEAYIAELLFTLKENKVRFRLINDLSNPNDREFYELEKRLMKSKYVTVFIRSFDMSHSELKVYGLSIDGRDVLNAKAISGNESMIYIGLFFTGVLALLYGLRILEPYNP